MSLRLRSAGWMKWALVVLVFVASTALVSSTKSPFSEHDKAYYADQATVDFIRPGLVFKVVSHEIAADGTVKVRFKMTDPKGVGLEREGINTAGPVSASFLLATIPANGKFYQSYITRVKTSTYAPTVGKTARQATGESNGKFEKVADGEYTYTFSNKLPASYDKTATHTIAIYGSRNLSEFGLSTYYASTTYNFVPDGSAIKKVRDVISTASCNKCHDDLSFHGGSRKGVEVCVVCHAPAYSLNGVNVDNTNPETGNTFDMTVMVHKIHAGSSLQSVKAGTPYQIVGFGNAVSDFSKVAMPSGPTNCAWCHEEKNTATQKDNYLKAPTRDACGACHDKVEWASGKGHSTANLAQTNDNQCANCHIPQGEMDYDASIKGAHMPESDTTLAKGIVVKITNVENTKPGQNPVISFTMKDRKGNPYEFKDVIPGAGRGRVGFTLAGPTTDYGTGISATGTNGYVTDALTATSATGSGGTYKYTFSKPIPADAKGTWLIASEGRTDEKLLAGTTKEKIVEVGMPNDMYYFSVDGTAVAKRRLVVQNSTCESCHYKLSFHGMNRQNTEYCVVCHNPNMTDAARRPAAQAPNESISMASMIHRIHTAREQGRPIIIYGFGNAANDFSLAEFPAPASAKKCSMCHVGTTYNAPAKGVLPVVDPRGYISPVGPTSAACLSCHVSIDAASHALANTTKLGESCAACHGPNSDFAVAKVHAQ